MEFWTELPVMLQIDKFYVDSFSTTVVQWKKLQDIKDTETVADIGFEIHQPTWLR